MNHLKYRVLGTISFLAFAFLVCLPMAAQAADILYAHFENQDFHDLKAEACCDHSIKIINSPRRSGTYAVKFILNSDDAGYINGRWQDPARRVILRKNETAKVGDTRWYGISIMVDPSWKDDTSDPNGTAMASWHRSPDPGEEAKPGHLSIEVTKSNRWEVRNISDPNPITTKTSLTKRNWDVGAVEKGKWVDWVVYAKWSYKSDGILKVWKDGKLVVDHRGPNTYNDINPEFFKVGVYKAWWIHELPPQRNTLTAYYDEISIGDQNSSYAEVAPQGSQSTPPPLSIPVNLRVK